jgi:hypothetical protein
MSFTNLEKTHIELARQIYGEKLPQRIFRNTRTFVNIAQDLRDKNQT